MRFYLNKIYNAAGYLAAFFILAICVLVMAQVSLNLIDKTYSAITGEAIGLTIPSYADFTGFFLAAASFLALAYTLREGGHIRVSLITHQLPLSMQRVAEVFCLAVAAGTACYFTWYLGALVHESWFYDDLSAGMIAVPIWIPQTSAFVGLLILSIALIDELVLVLQGEEASFAGKGENLLDETEAELNKIVAMKEKTS